MGLMRCGWNGLSALVVFSLGTWGFAPGWYRFGPLALPIPLSREYQNTFLAERKFALNLSKGCVQVVRERSVAKAVRLEPLDSITRRFSKLTDTGQEQWKRTKATVTRFGGTTDEPLRRCLGQKRMEPLFFARPSKLNDDLKFYFLNCVPHEGNCRGLFHRLQVFFGIALASSVGGAGHRCRANRISFSAPQSLRFFVDGCFWHGCPRHGRTPKARVAFWTAKLARNAQRDRAVSRVLRAAGWTVLRVSECALSRQRSGRTIARIARALSRTLRQTAAASARVGAIKASARR